MRNDLISSALAVVVFTLLLGLAYPLVVTGLAQVAFPNEAGGSQLTRSASSAARGERAGEVVGSRLIGQDFRGRPRYFQSRPSATRHRADATFFNNLGPNSRALKDRFDANVARYVRREGVPASRVPADAVQFSASGVDPHISEDNAAIQARRVARVRGADLPRVRALVAEHTDGRGLGVLGEPGVNVLELNLALDQAGSR